MARNISFSCAHILVFVYYIPCIIFICLFICINYYINIYISADIIININTYVLCIIYTLIAMNSIVTALFILCDIDIYIQIYPLTTFFYIQDTRFFFHRMIQDVNCQGYHKLYCTGTKIFLFFSHPASPYIF